MILMKILKEVRLLVLQSYLQFNIIPMRIKSNTILMIPKSSPSSSSRQWLNLVKTIILCKGSIKFKLQWKKNSTKKINLSNSNRDNARTWDQNLQIISRAGNQEVLLKEVLQSSLKVKLKEESRLLEKHTIAEMDLFKEWVLLKISILNYWNNKISSEIQPSKDNGLILKLNLNKKMISKSAI